MKRLLSVLFLIILMSTVMITVAAADDTVYTGDKLNVIERLWATNATVTSETDSSDGISYMRVSAEAGEYANGSLKIHFCPRDISLGDYPYIKVIYRTNAISGIMDTTNRTVRGEGWPSEHPALNNDEKWHSTVVDMTAMTGGTGVGFPGEMDIQLVLKPFGTRSTVLLDDAYCDIHTIACFKTLEEAESYTAGIEYVEEEKVLTKSVYGVNRLEKEYVISVSESGLSLSLEDGYYHVTAKPGSYTNDDLKITFLFADISLTELRYVKFRYRTDSVSQRIDTTIRSSGNESWPSSHPVPKGDGKWHEEIIDIFDMTGGGGVPPVGELGIRLVLKPFGAGNVTLAKDQYFDIEYVACFPTKEEAESYVYNVEDDKSGIGAAYESAVLEYADSALVEKYMNEIEERINEIIYTETDVTVSGTKYYVSADGDDNNDGKSPETAWKTIGKINQTTFSEGDGIFFRRGDSFRTVDTIIVQNGVTYSAYGYGHKPIILCSVDGSGAEKWIETDAPNVYKFAEEIPGGTRDVGNIVLDGGVANGIQIQSTKSGNRHNIGRVFNGLEWINTSTGKFDGYKDLNANLEFYHDWDTNTLYLYSAHGNPGELYDSIEIVDKGNGFSGKEVKNVVIDNIEVFGTGSHGIGFSSVWDSTVQNCVFRFIGGSIQGKYIFGRDYSTRYGNAVESSGNAINFTIQNNYASQIYDCCWTVQNTGSFTFDNVVMRDNVSEFCNTGLEVWMSGGRLTNMQLYNNYTRYNGYGWSNQRPNKDGNFFYGAEGLANIMYGNDVYNNVNIFASHKAIIAVATGKDQYNFHDNVYIMEEGKLLGGISATPENGSGSWVNTPYDARSIARVTARGYELGSKFYIADSPYENMYDIYVPYERVKMYSDVNDDFWGKEAVDFVTSKGYFKGITHTEFAPDGTMTRAMLVTVLARIAGETSTGKSSFADVNSSAWYIPGVAWAEENGIVAKGGNFRPDELATREEIADMIYRLSVKMGIKTESKDVQFEDFNTVSEGYRDGMKFCTSNGIISGYTDGTIKPQNDVTRAQAAIMIQRFVNLIG